MINSKQVFGVVAVCTGLVFLLPPWFFGGLPFGDAEWIAAIPFTWICLMIITVGSWYFIDGTKNKDGK